MKCALVPVQWYDNLHNYWNPDSDEPATMQKGFGLPDWLAAALISYLSACEDASAKKLLHELTVREVI